MSNFVTRGWAGQYHQAGTVWWEYCVHYAHFDVGWIVVFYEKLQTAWKQQRSMLCIGLDPQFALLPEHLKSRDRCYFEFCKAIVDTTNDLVCAYKPQAAHFAAMGYEDQLAELIAYIKSSYPRIPVILDAKRGDVGSTAEFYAIEAFERYDADAVTVNPYLGYESVAPYLAYGDRGVVVLCRTSNSGSDWLQAYPPNGEPVFARVAREVCKWNGHKQCMLVTGATYPRELRQVREIVGDMPLLVPGVGVQGGSIADVVANGRDSAGNGLVISSSRGILFARPPAESRHSGSRPGNAPHGQDFAAAARAKAVDARADIERCRK